MYKTMKKAVVYGAIVTTLLTGVAYADNVIGRFIGRTYEFGKSVVLAPGEAFGTFCQQVEKDGVIKGSLKGVGGAIANPASSIAGRGLEMTFTLPDPNRLDNRKFCDQSSLKNITDAVGDPLKAD